MAATTILERVLGDQDPIVDQILVNGTVSDFTGASNPILKVRPTTTTNVYDLSAAWSTITTGSISYSPASDDVLVTTAGLYAAWWYIAQMPDGEPQSGPIFYILVQDPTGASGGTPIDLCTVQDVKMAFEPSIPTTTRDVLIQTKITSASLDIMAWLDRELAPLSTETRRFRVRYEGDNAYTGQVVDLAPYDLRSITSVVMHPESAQPTTLLDMDSTDGIGYTLEPPQGDPLTGTWYKLKLSDLLVYTSQFSLNTGYVNLDVTGNWGCWSTSQVPQWVRDAVVLCVRSWIRQNPAAYAFAEIARPQETIGAEIPATFGIPMGTREALGRLQRRDL